jgi:hypothetical protein
MKAGALSIAARISVRRCTKLLLKAVANRLPSAPVIGKGYRWVIEKAASQHMALTKQRLAREIYNSAAGRILSGPFKGAKLKLQSNWSDDVGAMLIGQYEPEVLETLSSLDLHSFDAALDVGCSNGYYLVGLGSVNREIRLIGFEASEHDRKLTIENLALNGIDHRAKVLGFCDARILKNEIVSSVKPLVIIDIEGAEEEIFDETEIEAYRNAEFIIEMHDIDDDRVTKKIELMFGRSHSVKRIKRAGRNPFVLESFHRRHDFEAFALTFENRGITSRWLHLKPAWQG